MAGYAKLPEGEAGLGPARAHAEPVLSRREGGGSRGNHGFTRARFILARREPT
jgi:hypothetical protein